MPLESRGTGSSLLPALRAGACFCNAILNQPNHPLDFGTQPALLVYTNPL